MIDSPVAGSDPINECAECLHPLVEQFGFRVVEQALQMLIDEDPVEQDRISEACRKVLGDSPLLDELFPGEASS